MTLDDLGLNAVRLIAGFSGGAVHALVFKQREPMAVVASVVTGTLTANFLSPLIAHYIPWLGDGACAFLVGLTAMALCQGLVGIVQVRARRAVAEEKASKETRP